MVAITGELRAVATVGAVARVEVAAAEEAAAAPVVPAVVVAAVVVADLLAAVGGATGGHIREECTTRDSDFIAECARCLSFVHDESTCSSDAAVLAMGLPMSEEDLAVEAQAFVVEETGKCIVMLGEEVEGGELGKQVVQYIADSAATCITTPDTDGRTNYRLCSRPLGLANGGTTTIAGYGDLTVAFRSDHGWVHVKLHDVAHAFMLSYNLISLPSLALKGHIYAGDKYRVTLKLNGVEGRTFPLDWKALPPVQVPPRGEG